MASKKQDWGEVYQKMVDTINSNADKIEEGKKKKKKRNIYTGHWGGLQDHDYGESGEGGDGGSE
jgi:hypothetical protein